MRAPSIPDNRDIAADAMLVRHCTLSPHETRFPIRCERPPRVDRLHCATVRQTSRLPWFWLDRERAALLLRERRAGGRAYLDFRNRKNSESGLSTRVVSLSRALV